MKNPDTPITSSSIHPKHWDFVPRHGGAGAKPNALLRFRGSAVRDGRHDFEAGEAWGADHQTIGWTVGWNVS